MIKDVKEERTVMQAYHSCFSESVILEEEEKDLVGEVDILEGEVDMLVASVDCSGTDMGMNN